MVSRLVGKSFRHIQFVLTNFTKSIVNKITAIVSGTRRNAQHSPAHEIKEKKLSFNITTTLDASLQLTSGITGDGAFAKFLGNVATAVHTFAAFGEQHITSAFALPFGGASALYIRCLPTSVGNLTLAWSTTGGAANTVATLTPGSLILITQGQQSLGTIITSILVTPVSGACDVEYMLAT